ncbi:MAG: hypothetical protein R3F27_07535 [Gammaproteobacteria bacterium]
MAEHPLEQIHVVESPTGEDPIPLRRETVTAFVGPAPRGPAHIPVAIDSVAAFRKRFGSPAERSRMEWILGQYFENGGRSAIVVRVPRPGAPNRLSLPGPGGSLDLAARNPGPLEYLRAAVDYDNVAADDLWRFNLTVQRIRSPSNPLVEEQEIWRGVSIVPDEADHIGEVLGESALVRLAGDLPRARPFVTPGANGIGPVGYVYASGERRGGRSPTDYDLIGSDQECTGLHALNQVAFVDLICLLSGAPDTDIGPVGLFAAERYCMKRNAILLLDPPSHWSQVEDVARSQRDSPFASPNVMTYFPLLAGTTTDGGTSRPLSALGAIAGMLAARDRQTEPAGQRSAASAAEPEPLLLRSRARVAIEPDAEDARTLARSGVNLLRPAAPGFIAFSGDVTLARSSGAHREWRQLSLRRRAVMTASNIAHNTRWAAIQAPGPETWQAVADQISRYLSESQSAGLLAGDTPRRAFYVKCDQDTNGRGHGLSFVVGLALARPDEFVAFRFEHDVADCRVTEISDWCRSI